LFLNENASWTQPFLNSLADVALAGVQSGQVLGWNGTPWANASISSGGSGSSISTAAFGRSIVLCAGFTPLITGADVAEIPIPYSEADGVTALTWTVRRFFVRVQTAGGAPALSWEKYSGLAGFVPVFLGSLALSSGASQGSLIGAGSLYSGDKVRFNVSSLGTALNWSVGLEISSP